MSNPSSRHDPHHEPTAELAGRLRVATLSFASYLGVFVVGLWPWIRTAAGATPLDSRGGIPSDNLLVVWILGWAASALSQNPGHLFDAPINHPASGQLAGSEHLLSWQLLFSPVYWITDNPLLAGAVTVWLTYPLGAFAMQRLLTAIGVAPFPAWVAGLAYALGPLQVPAHMQLLQYSNLFLPVTALAVTRLRENPGLARAALFAIALGVGVLSSYYTAFMLLMTAVVWIAFEVFRRRDQRTRFILWALASAGSVLLVLTLVSLPYLQRTEAATGRHVPWEDAIRMAELGGFATAFITHAGVVLCAVAACGIAGLLVADRSIRALALRGLLLAVLAQTLMLGRVAVIKGVAVPLPYLLIAESPLFFFRAYGRIIVVMGFGATLLSAGALQCVQRLGARLATGALAAIAMLILFDRGLLLTDTEMRAVEEHQHPVYDDIRRLTRIHGSGPIIELPMTVTGFSSEVRSMIASLRHGLPVILGRTGYEPPHYLMVQAAVARLPDRDHLRALRTATGLGWILLRPAEQWAAGRRWFRAALLQSPDLERMNLRDGYDLLRVTVKPYDVDWYEAIRLGPQEGKTALGTPLVPVDPQDVNVVVLGEVSTMVQCSQRFPFTVTVINRGETALPGAGHLRKDEVAPDHAVGVRARFWSTPDKPQAAPVRDKWLPIMWDVPASGRTSQEASLEAPTEPGRYTLELAIQQKGGGILSDPPNEASRFRVIVGRGPDCS